MLCQTCHQEKPIEEMNRHGKYKSVQYYRCKLCAEKFRKRKEGKSDDEFRKISSERTRQYKKNLRIKILNKLGNKCVQCGYNDIRALEIDHVDGTGYLLERNSSRRQTWFVQILNDEVTNAQLLCANCHKIKTVEKEEGKVRK